MNDEEVAEDALLTREEALAAGGIDLDNLVPQQHIWVKRGIKLSCEGDAHPHHSHFLRDK